MARKTARRRPSAPARRGAEERVRPHLVTPFHRLLPHVKVGFAFLVWIALLREQAMAMARWPDFFAQALVACGALAVCSVVVVYAYPPRTARWRTLLWAFLASTAAGAAAYGLFGGRMGSLGALVGGGAVLAARSEELGRRTVRRLRERKG